MGQGQGDEADPRRSDYRIPEDALRKWADGCLTCRHTGSGRRRYCFAYTGSTCVGGGDAFTANLQIVVEESARGPVVADALVAFPVECRSAVRKMCEYQKRGEPFLDELQEAPSFCGKTIDEILAEREPENPAGCFCTPPMVNHKWRLALSTVHYALASEGRSTHDGRES